MADNANDANFERATSALDTMTIGTVAPRIIPAIVPPAR